MYPYLDLSHSTDWDFTMASGAWAGYLNRLSLSTLASPIPPFLILSNCLAFLPLSYLSTTYLHIVVAPTVDEPRDQLGSSSH